MASCERCKQRKAKCDRQLPSCRRCERAQVSCEYSGRRKPGFPAGHRQMLEDKIERLETELRAIHGSTRRTSTSTEPGAVPGTEATIQALSTLSPQQSQATLTTYERTRRIKERQPPTDLVISLASLYFRHIHPWFPFLDVQRVCADMGSVDEPSLLYYALFGVALPYSFDSRLDKVSSDSFWKYSKRSIFIDVLEEPSYSSLEVLTVLILDLSGMTHGPQVWGPLAVATKLAVQLKNIHGLVFRTSTEAEDNEPFGKSRDTFRQRLFWAIYALDCSICITTNHLSSLSDNHIEYFLPARQHIWRETSSELEETVLSPPFIFSYQLELFDLSRQIHKLAFEYAAFSHGQGVTPAWLDDFQNTSTKLSMWMQNLHPQLLWPTQNNVVGNIVKVAPPALLVLHAYFHGLIIHMNGLVAFATSGPLQPAIPSEISQECLERCTQSIRNLTEIITKAACHAEDKLGWTLAWSVWVAARFMVAQICVVGESESHRVSTLSLFTEFLRRLGRFWQISATYARILRQSISELDRCTALQTEQGSILQLMANFRVATSQIEDQSRPDPILRGMINLEVPDTTSENANRMDVEQSDTSMSIFPSEICFDALFETPDNWFRVPLYASSAYQQSNIPQQE